jgi:uncharacterized protein (DUF2236 family)
MADRVSPDPLAQIRSALQQSIRKTLVGDQPPVRDLSKATIGDPGLFGPDSITWKVHADAAMLIGGVRALLLQTMHPLAMAGIAEHSAYRTDPTGRLWRTASFVGTTSFGTTKEAKKAIAVVKKVHERVVGVAPDGRPYAANDPHLMAWVHHSLVDSFLAAYQRFGSVRLSDDEADQYVREQAKLARLLGADQPAPAEDVAGLQRWLRGIRPELLAGKQAHDATRYLLTPKLPLASRPAYAVLAGGAIGLLPGFVRRQLRLPILPVTETFAVRPAAIVLTRGIGWAMSAPMPESTAS